LLEDQALGRELGRRGLEFVIRNYGKDRLLRDMVELYAQLMPGNSPTIREGSGASANDYHARLTPHH